MPEMEPTVDTKYYTPELEEFHIGFEYEFQGRDGYWNPQGWETHTIVCEKKEVGVWKSTMDVVTELYLFYGEVDKNSFRVKYLDKEDIESLGCEQDKNDSFKFKSEVCEIHFFTKNRISVFASNGSSFTGICKNKSKLKSILKDVGVL